jgi:HlyD family secretion protein
MSAKKCLFFHHRFEHVQEEENEMKKIMSCILVLVVALACFGCGKQKLASDETWGRADAKEIDINSKIAGRVVQLNVKEGDTVKEGQIIAKIDQRDLLAKKAQIEADIEALRAQQLQAAQTTDLQQGSTQSELGQAQAARDQSASNLALAQADYERYQELIDEGAVSEQAFEQYRTKYQVAQANLGQAEQAVNKATAGLKQTDVSRANETAAAKKIAAAEAQLQQLEVNLDETEIKAPYDGIITAKYIEEGSMISTGTPLVAVQDPTDNWVDLKVPETELSRYKLNQPVRLMARDGKTEVEGTITDISKKSEFATQRATSERG